MRYRIILAIAISAVAARSLAAQTDARSTNTNRNQSSIPSSAAPQARADSSSVYDSQALRFESSWGSGYIIRGAKGEAVGTVGWFRDFDVEKLVQTSPQAGSAAREFRVANFRGSLVSTIGASLVAIGIAVATNNSNTASTPILIIAGAGGIGWGLQKINSSYAALSRALWWYNRDLSR